MTRLAVLGDPLAYTRSPELHRAGLAALGLAGDSAALRTPVAALAERLAGLEAGGATGVNLTTPLKEAALPLLARISEFATRARSVNTVGFSADGRWGDSTDGPGFLDVLESRGRPARGLRLCLAGAGGAARSIALALERAGAAGVTMIARRPAAIAESWAGIASARRLGWGTAEAGEAWREADVVVLATPAAAPEPARIEDLPSGALLVDLAYGPAPTPRVVRARTLGCDAEDGLGLLVHQARRSLELWFGRSVPLEPLARAVGWPR